MIIKVELSGGSAQVLLSEQVVRKKFDELTDDVSTFKILYFFCFVLYFNSHQRYFQLKGE